MADELTIDELARETGMTVRNIRAHQSRGLLPPPEVRARTGYYGPELTTAEELARRFGGTLDVKALQKAEKLGLIRPLGDDRFELVSPTLMRAGEELVALGIPLSHALAVAERIQRNSRPIADAFIRLFVEDVIGPGDPTQRTPEEWERLRDALERLRPLATEAVRAGFQQTMSAAVDEQVAKIVGD